MRERGKGREECSDRRKANKKNLAEIDEEGKGMSENSGRREV